MEYNKFIKNKGVTLMENILNSPKIKVSISTVISQSKVVNKKQVSELLKTKFNIDICECCIEFYLNELDIKLA